MAPLQIGFLLIPFQVLDVAGPLDVLSSCSQPYLKTMKFPPTIWEKGLDIKFHHLSDSMAPSAGHTGNTHFLPTTTFADCPRLDYLLIGGPDPAFQLPQSYKDFIHSRFHEVEVIFTTCTGALILAQTGLLDGKEATTNHFCVPLGQELFPKVKWTMAAQWVVDGKFWTAGGACAGMDMVAHWVWQKCGRDVAEAGFAVLDYEPRDINRRMVPLSTSNVAEMMAKGSHVLQVLSDEEGLHKIHVLKDLGDWRSEFMQKHLGMGAEKQVLSAQESLHKIHTKKVCGHLSKSTPGRVQVALGLSYFCNFQI